MPSNAKPTVSTIIPALRYRDAPAATDSDYGRLMRQPKDVGGGTQSPYVIVADADAHYARAKAAGAEILLELEDEDHGGRSYSARDPEGHLWNFGTHDPWVK